MRAGKGLMHWVNSRSITRVLGPNGTYKDMKTSTYERHNRKTPMNYANGEEIKQFDLVAIGNSYGLEYGVVWSTGRTIKFREIGRYEPKTPWGETLAKSVQYDLGLLKRKDLMQTANHFPGHSYTFFNRRQFQSVQSENRVVKISPDQLSKEARAFYDQILEWIKQAKGED